MTLEDSAQIEEVRLVLRWAGKVLTDAERGSLTDFLTGETDEDMAAQAGTTPSFIVKQRKEALGKLKAQLCKLGISRCSDLLSTADLPRKSKASTAKILDERGRLVTDITAGRCMRGHDRKHYSKRSKDGHLRCIVCSNDLAKTKRRKQ